MGSHAKKRDRTARLLHIQMLLGQNPGGLKIQELANSCSVDVRTIYRDLRALESELNVPVWQDRKYRGLVKGYNIPSIPFSLMEATYVFLSLRLLQNYSRWFDPNINSTFIKLEKVVPPALKKHIKTILEWEAMQPKNEKLIQSFETLVNAWITQHRIKIWYQDLFHELQEHVIDPYFIDPTSGSHVSYVLAYDHTNQSIEAFRINNIEKISVEPDIFTIPSEFNALDYISSAWGMLLTGRVETIKLKFPAYLNKAVSSSIWHQTQILETLADGTLIMTLRVKNNDDLRHWIMSWGDDVEVLEPQSLREEIIKIIESLHRKYISQSENSLKEP